MKFDSAKNTMDIAESGHRFFLLTDRLRQSMDMVNHRYVATPDQCYQTVVALWEKEAKITLRPSDVEVILSLYPRDRILLTEIGNTINPDVREAMLNVLSHFFLGCKWPDFGDSVDMERFTSLLQHQFNESGI